MKVTRYNTLRSYAKAFSDGNLSLIILVGRPGTSKSRTFKHAMSQDRVCWIEGTASAFGLYQELYEHRNLPVVIDDVDGLLKDRAAVRLLKSLCQTEEVKELQWKTNAAGKASLPNEFTTTSHVCVIANEWDDSNPNAAAITDRGHFIEFEPSLQTLHDEVGTWFENRQIYRWFNRHLARLPELSMRDYVRCNELHAAGLDWKRSALEDVTVEDAKIIQDLDALHQQHVLGRYLPILKQLKEQAELYRKIGKFEKANRVYKKCRAILAPHAEQLRKQVNV